MPETQTAPMSLGTIFAIMLATGFVVGITLAGLRELFGFEGGTAGVGASAGVVGALLLARRARALREQAKP